MRLASLFFCFLIPAAFAAEVVWTGANGDWEDATNWSSNPHLPMSGDAVSIVVENAVRTIDHNEGETTIDSLVLEERLLISGGSLTTGELEMLPGGQLISLGQFSATGATSAESISLTAGQSNVGSGTISLPNLTDFGTENQIGWSSYESESLIDLPALTNISGPSASFRVFSITAARGGEINLNSVTAIASRNDTSVVKITAENDGSVIDLSGMNDLVGTGITELSVTDGAEIRWGTLRAADGVNLTLGGTFDTSQLASVTNGSIRSENGDAPVPDLDAVTTVDDSSLYAGRGFVSPGSVRLPLVDVYSVRETARWEATEVGSVLDLSGMTTINGPSSSSRVFSITASRGGLIDLQNVTNVIQRNDTSRVQIIAEDAGSIVDLSRMNDLIGSGITDVIVHENAEVKWGNLTVADQVNFRLGGTLDTSTLTSVSNGSITAENGSSPAPNLDAVTNVESSSLAAGLSSVKPGVLRLPNLSTYSTSVSTTLSAVETGSLLDLSGVRTLNGPDEGFRELAVLAQLGGSVDLSGVTSINQRNSTSLVAITAQDAGSLVDLSGINDLTNSGITDITVQDGGEIRLGSLLRADGIRFFVGGVLDTANLTSVTNGSIEAEHGDLPAPNLGNVTDAESSSLRAGSAGVTGRLALPNLETYSTSVTTNLTATDAGSLLDLSAVETINGPDESFRVLSVGAFSGATVDLSSVTKINRRSDTSVVVVTANDPGSVVDLSSINDLTDEGIQEINVAAGGEIRLGSLVSADQVTFRIGGIVDSSNLTTLTNGSLSVEDTSFGEADFSSVTNIDGTSISAGFSGVSAGTLALPGVTTYGTDFGKSIRASQPGSVLDMSRLQTLNAPTQAFQNITIAATTGGRIDLSGLTTVNESVSTSKVVIEAQDPQSLVDLRSLNDSGAIEEIHATTSGQIVLGDIDAANVDIAATENGQITANRITLLSNAVLHGSGIDGSVTNTLGRVEIDEPSMEISGQYLHDGGELTIPANTSLIVGADYDNSAFGSGRDFNSRANIPGSGTILAVAAGQEITGDVTGGTSPRPTVSLGNVHVGKTLTRNYGIRNSGAETSLRGAMTTDFAGAPGNNSLLSGDGSEGSFGPIQPGATSEFPVSVTPQEAGPIPEQQVLVSNNFDNVDSQIVTFTGTAYRLAEPLVSPKSIDFGIVHVNDTLPPRPIEIRNDATDDPYSESLNATPSAEGAVPDAGSAIQDLPPQVSNNTSVFATLDTSSSGFKTGAVVLEFESDGTGSSELGRTRLPSQSVAVTGQVNEYAMPSFLLNGAATATFDLDGHLVVDFGTIFQGLGSMEATLSLVNDVVVPADDLAEGTWVTDGAVTYAGFEDFAAIAPGDSRQSTIIVSDATVGIIEGSATLFANSANPSGFSEPITPLQIFVVGRVVPVPEPTVSFGLIVCLLALFRRRVADSF